ncbi:MULTISPECIES: hypothetical protein [unclassified Bradyrhizobium]|uniref:hypothetical protein n=1 Tax=unclassified Bradyrhizobium TaxID=2631580 RepID=UPI001FF84C6A|nr:MULTISPECIES: hypothetical protein [unclassified Bradyrhizobium]MCK1707792.1 hypothetical protein [Bradyrhizobium sp. 143]MCK1726245.1 hypothetical protein [Bradyrhizobium sp. 142]
MPQTTDQLANIEPSATPTEAERKVWAVLPRDEQVRRHQELFALPNCNNFTSDTPDDILATARQRVAQRVMTEDR